MTDNELMFQEIKRAVAATLDPFTSRDDRIRATTFLEEIRNDVQRAPLLLQIGFRLIYMQNEAAYSQIQSANFVRFGFQLVENVVKLCWNSMNDTDKAEIKAQLEKLICANNFTERHLKDCISKCVVEVINRDWPQKWPNLFPFLLNAKRSDTVLYIFWRLAEDVGVFFLPNNPQRRREILHSLVAATPDVMLYIADCLQSNDISLCLAALRTLTGFLEWSTIDTSLLTFLCTVLSTDVPVEGQFFEVKLLALECLLICLQRKGLKIDEKKSMLVLFNESNFSVLGKLLQQLLCVTANEKFTNNDFTLAKRLCSTFAAAGQLVLSVGPCAEVTSEIWSSYLVAMQTVLVHSNQVFSSIALPFWRDLFRNSKAYEAWLNSLLVGQLFMAFPQKLVKQEDPLALSTSFEFDAKEDYEEFYYKFRADILDFLRLLAQADGKVCFECSLTILQNCLSKQASVSEWEVIAHLLDAVCNKLKDIKQHAPQGLLVLDVMLSLPLDANPDKISEQLSCISALNSFVPGSPHPSLVLQKIIHKIFELASYSQPGERKGLRSNEAKNLRRHACSCLVKVSKTYGQLLVPLFPDIRAKILQIAQADDFSQMEVCTLNEALMIIFNEFSDLTLAKGVAMELLQPLQWILTFNPTTPQFISFVGVALRDSNDDETLGKNRASLLFVVNTLLGFLKRVTKKDIFYPDILPFVKALIPVIANLNSMWSVEFQALSAPHYRSLIYEHATELEKQHLLESPNATIPDLEGKTPAHRIQNFLWNLHENAFSVLGLTFSTLSPEIADYAAEFLDALRDADHLPSMKLKMILKCFIKPLVQKCPSSSLHYEKILVPIVNYFLPFLFRKINARWDQVKERNQTLEEEHTNDQEVLDKELVEDQSNRLLSREFVDVLTVLLLQSVERVRSKEDNVDEMKDVSRSDNDAVRLSDAGSFLIQGSLEALTTTTIVSITWLDSITSHKAALISLVLLDKLVSEDLIRSKDAVRFFLKHIITALNYFGEHDQNQARLLQLVLALYEGVVIKRGIEEAKLGFYEASGRDAESWKSLEETLQKPPGPVGTRTTVSEKKKRDALKALLGTVIGKSVSQLHAQNKAEIKSLQPLLTKSRRSFSMSHDVFSDEVGLCQLFGEK